MVPDSTQATEDAPPYFRALLNELDGLPANEQLWGPGAMRIHVGHLRDEIRKLLAPRAYVEAPTCDNDKENCRIVGGRCEQHFW